MPPLKIDISVDGTTVTVLENTTLLDALRGAGVDIPTLCAHKDLTPTGNCRLCMCEVEQRGKKRLVTACNFPIRNEMRVETHSPRVMQHRRIVAQMYLGRWPNVPVVRDVAAQCGVTDASRFTSALTDENPKACILCGRCTKACEEFIQERILDFAGRGIKRHMTMPFGEVDPHCVGCTSCAYVCPTGAIQVIDDLNHPADPIMIRNHGMRVNAEMATLDTKQNRMRSVGTANIVDVMDAYDLLPVHNHQYGRHEDTKNISSWIMARDYLTQGQPDQCWHGCSMACAKASDNFELRTGPYKGHKVVVDGPEYETAAGSANMGCFDMPFVLEYNFYCDTYGIDTISFSTTMSFVMECYERGIITKEHTGGLDLRFGSTMDTLEVLHRMARGEGFGVDVGQGVRLLKEKWVRELGADRAFLDDIGMEVKGLEFSEYVCKESLAQQGGYSMAVKGPQHDEAWLIFMDMVNNQIPSFEDKAEALHYFPLFRTWFGLMGLCKIVWNDIVPADNKKHPPQQAAKIPEHVENYWKFFEGMTGIALDEQKMLDQSGRVYNLQRALSYKLAGITRKDDVPPARALGPVTELEYESRAERYDKQMRDVIGIDPDGKTTAEKLAIVRRHRVEQYAKLMDVVYARRGWTQDGVPTIARLRELGIDLPVIVDMVRAAQEHDAA